MPMVISKSSARCLSGPFQECSCEGLKHANAGADAVDTRGSGEATHQVVEACQSQTIFLTEAMDGISSVLNSSASRRGGVPPPHLHTPTKV